MLICLALTASACSKKTPTSPTDVVPPAQTTCIYSVSTTTLNIAGAGGSASLSVNTGTGCAWTVSSSSTFISVSSATSQTGPGPVNFAVAENPGDTRTGTLLIAGQTVTVNQAPNDPVYGNWGGTLVKGSGCAATLPASVDYTGTIRRTSGATNEFLISIPTVGVVNQALALTITGSNLQFFVPIDTLYTFNATLASDRRSLTGTFSGGTCSGTWNGTRR
jgi:hypothetical protein